MFAGVLHAQLLLYEGSEPIKLSKYAIVRDNGSKSTTRGSILVLSDVLKISGGGYYFLIAQEDCLMFTRKEHHPKYLQHPDVKALDVVLVKLNKIKNKALERAGEYDLRQD